MVLDLQLAFHMIIQNVFFNDFSFFCGKQYIQKAHISKFHNLIPRKWVGNNELKAYKIIKLKNYGS